MEKNAKNFAKLIFSKSIFTRVKVNLLEGACRLTEGDRVNRFVARDPYRDYSLGNMAFELSTVLRVSPEVIKQYSMKAMTDWEIQHSKPIANIFAMSKDEQRIAVENIIENLNRYIKPIVESEKRLDKYKVSAVDHYMEFFSKF